MCNIPKVGVGFVYTPTLGNLLKNGYVNFDVLEFEPQTHWTTNNSITGEFKELASISDIFRNLPCPHALVHSIGMPVAGTRTPSNKQLSLLKKTCLELNSPWFSDHLSVGGTPHLNAGFLLPPCQTSEGVDIAVKNIMYIQDYVGKPFAIETGVSYLKRRRYEMSDGQFIREIVNQTGCGILLDLHNVYTNHRNGRYSIDNFVGELPLDNVWEIHLAGGFESSGVYLDAHNGKMSDEFINIAYDMIPEFHNAGAIVFEILESFLKNMDVGEVQEVSEQLKDFWKENNNLSTKQHCDILENTFKPKAYSSVNTKVSAQHWENTLTKCIQNDVTNILFDDGDSEKIKFYSKLANSFRSAMLHKILERSIRYLVIRENDEANLILSEFYKSSDNQLYAHLESFEFKKWIENSSYTDDILQSLLEYDMAVYQSTIDGQSRKIKFAIDPLVLFECLVEFELPKIEHRDNTWELEILASNLLDAPDFTSSQAS